METEIKNEVTEKNISEPVEKKRTFINLAVTPEEKTQITKEAVSVCKISVSEYCRTKIFMPRPEEKTETITEVFTDEEKEIYENTLKELKAENTKLKDELSM
ncbi:MAG TPA: hypothetical protein VNZ49_08375 [Bacteroidia bacterium]|jgi:hypothetical protein|nr:hypothetical protein [Bacteroidia bacterium]